MNLYEINEQIELLTEQLVDEETGEINDEIMLQLEQLGIDRDEKIEGCGLVMKNLAAEISAINEEIKALKKRQTAKSNKLDRIGQYVKANLNGQKFETPKVAFGFRKSTAVEVVNDDIVPDDFCSFVTTRKPLKAEIKKELLAGNDVPGCVLIENMNLQIK